MTETAAADRLLGGRVRFEQPRRGYRAAIDPVFLAAYAEPPHQGRVIDLGCGAGAALLCLAARRTDLWLTGLDIDAEALSLARSNVADNGYDSRVTLFQGDAADPPVAVPRNSFDAVIMNPPFNTPGRDPAPPDASKARAHVEPDNGLAQWLDGARRLLRQRGQLTLIYRADRLDHVLAKLRPNFGSVIMTPLWPKKDQAAKRVLITAVKGGNAPLSLEPGVVLHTRDGAFTPAAESVLRAGSDLRTAASLPSA